MDRQINSRSALVILPKAQTDWLLLNPINQQMQIFSALRLQDREIMIPRLYLLRGDDWECLLNFPFSRVTPSPNSRHLKSDHAEKWGHGEMDHWLRHSQGGKYEEEEKFRNSWDYLKNRLCADKWFQNSIVDAKWRITTHFHQKEQRTERTRQSSA